MGTRGKNGARPVVSCWRVWLVKHSVRSPLMGSRGSRKCPAPPSPAQSHPALQSPGLLPNAQPSACPAAQPRPLAQACPLARAGFANSGRGPKKTRLGCTAHAQMRGRFGLTRQSYRGAILRRFGVSIAAPFWGNLMLGAPSRARRQVFGFVASNMFVPQLLSYPRLQKTHPRFERLGAFGVS